MNTEIESDVDAYSVATFCKRHAISISGFYQAMRQGWGPDVMRCGKRQLISKESAERWRRARERAAGAPPSSP